MSQPLKLAFKFQLNNSLKSMLVQPRQRVTHNKELIFILNRIIKGKLKSIFRKVKQAHTRSADALIKSLFISLKQSKKQNKVSYLPYSVNQVIQSNQTKIPKTPIFNSRVKNIKSDAFLKMKLFFFQVKSYQTLTILQNRQNELLNHLIPKIEQTICSYAFRRIIEHSKQTKGKGKIIRLLQKMVSNISKRVYYTDFFNRIKKCNSIISKKKLAIKKIIRIAKTSQKFIIQGVFRKIQLYQQIMSLDKKLSQKKQRISKIYDLNQERTTILQKQRQILRNLKYKLDHQAVEKNHVLTEKRRTLMLARTKSHEQTKQLNDLIQFTSSQVSKLQKLLQKQKTIHDKLQTNRKYVKEVRRNGVDFESMTIMMYKTISDLMSDDNIDAVLQIVKIQQHRNHQYEGFPLFEQIHKSRQYLCRKINLLQKIVKAYQKKESRSLNGSMIRPITQTLSTSQLKISPSASSLNGSRILGNSTMLMSRVKNMDSPQLLRVKQEYSLLQGLISLVLGKSFEIKIKQAITAEIQQLTELLASDLRDH